MTERRLTKQEVRTIELYTALMEEVKIRIDAFNVTVANQARLPSEIVQENCYLQLRFLCELIALACLTAHGDIGATHATKFREEYSADTILNALEELHSDFYPFPTKITRSGNQVTAELLKEGHFLKKPELIRLYGRAGDVLHRGKFKKLLSPQPPAKVDIPAVVESAQKIMNLLAIHTIARLSGSPLICILRNLDNAERVQVELLHPGPNPPGQ